MTWAQLDFLAVDTETTGVDTAADRIVEVAAVTVHPDGTVGDTWSTIVDPGIPIPAAASAVHGITNGRAAIEGTTPHDALAHLADLIAGHDGPVVIYNARFDWPLLLAEADRHGLPWPDAYLVDPFVLDKHIDPYRRGSRRLPDVAAHHGVHMAPGTAHGALADATAAGQLAAALCAAEPRITACPLPDLQTWQQRWHDDQTESFADYVRRNRDPQFTATLGWPLPDGRAA